MRDERLIAILRKYLYNDMVGEDETYDAIIRWACSKSPREANSRWGGYWRLGYLQAIDDFKRRLRGGEKGERGEA